MISSYLGHPLPTQVMDQAEYFHRLQQSDREIAEVLRRWQIWPSKRAVWVAAAHELWILAAMVFASAKQRISRQPSPFVGMITALLHRIGFRGVSETAVAKWAALHRAILPPHRNQDNR